MKILVGYMSLTGNTKKIAESIYEELPDDKMLMELKDVANLDA